jgi:hypothetical protein
VVIRANAFHCSACGYILITADQKLANDALRALAHYRDTQGNWAIDDVFNYLRALNADFSPSEIGEMKLCPSCVLKGIAASRLRRIDP